MKFSRELLSAAIPEWRLFFIDYHKLKSLIRQTTTQGDIEGSSSNGGVKPEQLDEFFWEFLEDELQKVSRFHDQKISWAKNQIAILEDAVAVLEATSRSERTRDDGDEESDDSPPLHAASAAVAAAAAAALAHAKASDGGRGRSTSDAPLRMLQARAVGRGMGGISMGNNTPSVPTGGAPSVGGGASGAPQGLDGDDDGDYRELDEGPGDLDSILGPGGLEPGSLVSSPALGALPWPPGLGVLGGGATGSGRLDKSPYISSRLAMHATGGVASGGGGLRRTPSESVLAPLDEEELAFQLDALPPASSSLLPPQHPGSASGHRGELTKGDGSYGSRLVTSPSPVPALGCGGAGAGDDDGHSVDSAGMSILSWDTPARYSQGGGPGAGGAHHPLSRTGSGASLSMSLGRKSVSASASASARGLRAIGWMPTPLPTPSAAGSLVSPDSASSSPFRTVLASPPPPAGGGAGGAGAGCTPGTSISTGAGAGLHSMDLTSPPPSAYTTSSTAVGGGGGLTHATSPKAVAAPHSTATVGAGASATASTAGAAASAVRHYRSFFTEGVQAEQVVLPLPPMPALPEEAQGQGEAPGEAPAAQGMLRIGVAGPSAHGAGGGGAEGTAWAPGSPSTSSTTLPRLAARVGLATPRSPHVLMSPKAHKLVASVSTAEAAAAQGPVNLTGTARALFSDPSPEEEKGAKGGEQAEQAEQAAGAPAAVQSDAPSLLHFADASAGISDFRLRFARVKKAVEDCDAEISLLKQYLHLNATAVYKATKKRDKQLRLAGLFDDPGWSGPGPLMTAYMAELYAPRSPYAFLQGAHLKAMSERVRSSLARLRSMEPGARAWKATKVYSIGCFDVFHHGHANLLKALKSFGRTVVVGIHDDASYKLLKGELPVDSLEVRMAHVRPFADQIFVIPSTDPTPYLAAAVSTADLDEGHAVYVRGDDMPSFPARAWCESHSMPIYLLPRTQAVSSTYIKLVYGGSGSGAGAGQGQGGLGGEQDAQRRVQMAFAQTDYAGKPILPAA